MASTFEGVVQQLNNTFNLNLNAENLEAVNLSFKDQQIQFELDENQENVLAICFLGEVKEGRYREDVLVQALRSNGFPQPNLGTFAYSSKMDTLILFHTMPVESVTQESLMNAASILYEKMVLWKEALASSMVPIIEKQKSDKPQMDLSSVMGMVRKS